MPNSFCFTGTGGSMGVPVIGCKCDVCHSCNKKNKRLRTAGILKVNNKTFVLDTGPDFRQQALRANLDHIDGVLLTHAHADHIAGMDDLRIFHFTQKESIPVLASSSTWKDVQKVYSYFFPPFTGDTSKSQKLEGTILADTFGSIEFLGEAFTYMSYYQAGMQVLGYRWKDFAYVTDVYDPSDSVFESLKGVKTLVISALRWTHSPVHLTVPEAIEFAKKVGADKTYITHIAHDLAHDETNRKLDELLPGKIELAYDGLEINI